MMTVRLRVGLMAARWALAGRRLDGDGTSRIALRCRVVDCDINWHMNNGRYLGFMDMGRWHYCLTHGIAHMFMRWKWRPMAVHAEIDFKKAIHPGQTFELETYLSAVGTKSVTFTQRFWLGEELASEAHVVVVFTAPDGTQPVARMMEALPALSTRLPVLVEA